MEQNQNTEERPLHEIITPLFDRIVVKQEEGETVTKGGIIIPDTAKEKPYKGRVLAVGPGMGEEPMQVKVGDLVLYGKYAGSDVNIEDKDYVIMRQSDCLCIFKGK